MRKKYNTVRHLKKYPPNWGLYHDFFKKYIKNQTRCTWRYRTIPTKQNCIFVWKTVLIMIFYRFWTFLNDFERFLDLLYLVKPNQLPQKQRNSFLSILYSKVEELDDYNPMNHRSFYPRLQWPYPEESYQKHEQVAPDRAIGQNILNTIRQRSLGITLKFSVNLKALSFRLHWDPLLWWVYGTA